MARIRPVNTCRQRDQLLLSHRPLVRPIAHHYARLSPEPVEDLIQVGLIGLLRAAESFDRGSLIPFDSFARPHIRGAILHHLRDRAWLVRLPRRLAEQQWSQRHHGHSQCGDRQQKDIQTLQRWRAMNRPLSLQGLEAGTAHSCEQGHVTEEDPRDPASQQVVDTVPDCEYVPVSLGSAWQSSSVEQMLAQVEPRQRTILKRVVLEGWSYRRTAEALKISAPTVQRQLHKALAVLRERLSDGPAPSVAPGC